LEEELGSGSLSHDGEDHMGLSPISG